MQSVGNAWFLKLFYCVGFLLAEKFHVCWYFFHILMDPGGINECAVVYEFLRGKSVMLFSSSFYHHSFLMHIYEQFGISNEKKIQRIFRFLEI